MTNTQDLFTLDNAGNFPELHDIVEAYYPPVLRACLSRLRDRSDAEDAAQDVFKKLLLSGRIHANDEPSRLLPWLLTCARNVCVDFIRSSQRRRRREDTVAGDACRETGLQSSWETSEFVERVLGKLSADERDLLHEHVLNERSQAEIASDLNITQQAVARRLSRIRAKLAHLGRDFWGMLVFFGTMLLTTWNSAKAGIGATTAYVGSSKKAVAGASVVVAAGVAVHVTTEPESVDFVAVEARWEQPEVTVTPTVGKMPFADATPAATPRVNKIHRQALAAKPIVIAQRSSPQVRYTVAPLVVPAQQPVAMARTQPQLRTQPMRLPDVVQQQPNTSNVSAGLALVRETRTVRRGDSGGSNNGYEYDDDDDRSYSLHQLFRPATGWRPSERGRSLFFSTPASDLWLEGVPVVGNLPVTADVAKVQKLASALKGSVLNGAPLPNASLVASAGVGDVEVAEVIAVLNAAGASSYHNWLADASSHGPAITDSQVLREDVLNLGEMTLTDTLVEGTFKSPRGSRVHLEGVNYFAGFASGAGELTGNGAAVYLGTHSPGDSPAIVRYQGDVVYAPSATLLIELAGLTPGEYDQLDIEGSALLSGELQVELLDDFVVEPGMSFEVITAGFLFGGFDNLVDGDFYTLPTGDLLYADYQLGLDGSLTLHAVEPEDFGELNRINQEGRSGTSSTVVPEPATLGLLAGGCLLLRRRRR